MLFVRPDIGLVKVNVTCSLVSASKKQSTVVELSDAQVTALCLLNSQIFLAIYIL
jgi:hypothetical protein